MEEIEDVLINIEDEEIEEMISSACLYDGIDPKLQKVFIKKVYIEKFDKKNFENLLERNNIKKTKKPSLNGIFVKDPRYGWGPNNTNKFLELTQELALKIKTLNYLN